MKRLTWRISWGPLTAMLEYDFMQNAFAAATIVSIVAGRGGVHLLVRRAALCRPCARPCRVHRGDGSRSYRRRAALGSDDDDGGGRDRCRHARRAARPARRGDRHRPRAIARLWLAVPALLNRLCDPGDRALV